MSVVSRLTGLIPPMVTPLTRHGDVDSAAVARHVEFLIGGGANGIFVLGSSGEGPWLTDQQAARVMQATVAAARGRVPVLAGALEPGTRRVQEGVQRAHDAGVDIAVVTTPYYFAADGDTQLRHFETVANSSPLPVVLYNIPSMTHNLLTPDIASRFLDHERIVGIKDSAGDWRAFEALLALSQQRPDFSVLQGAERQSAQALLAGADGLVPGLGNCVPALFASMIERARAGDADGARAVQAQIERLWPLHTHGVWVSCLKFATSLHSDIGSTTAGFSPLSDTAQAKIRQLVSSVGEFGHAV